MRRYTLTVLAGALCASLALAQDTTRTTTTSSSSTTTVQYQRVSQVVGTSVTLGSETLGKVTEVVVNSDGCIEYLIVQYADGFVPVPWAVTTVNFESHTITVTSTDVTVARLRELTFTEGRWPNFADQRFTQQVRTVWGDRAIRSGSGGTSGTRPGTTDRPGTKDRPGTTDRPGTPEKKDAPTRPKDTDTGEKPKLDLPKQDAPRKEPPKKDGDRKEPERPKDKKDKDGR